MWLVSAKISIKIIKNLKKKKFNRSFLQNPNHKPRLEISQLVWKVPPPRLLIKFLHQKRKLVLKKQKRHTHAMENLIDQSPEKEMATPLPGLYRRSLPSPPAIEFASSEGALGLGAAATALSSSLYTIDVGQRAVIFNPDLLSNHFSLHSLSLDKPRFAVFGFRSELLTCFCICVCVRFSL